MPWQVGKHYRNHLNKKVPPFLYVCLHTKNHSDLSNLRSTILVGMRFACELVFHVTFQFD